jgi:5-methyltetrahydrofolate--homocysteine methyltransferase
MKVKVLNISIDDAEKYLKEDLFLKRHFGITGAMLKTLEGKERIEKLKTEIELTKKYIRKFGLIKMKGVFGIFQVVAEENNLVILDKKEQKLTTFLCGRYNGKALTDYLVKEQRNEVGIFVVTTGNMGPFLQKLNKAGEFVKSHIIAVLAMELAEAAAEYMHQHILSLWGLDKSHRFSFGYPICPDLANQAKIWQLLNPKQIGVTLTNSFMMKPETSVSALVFKR